MVATGYIAIHVVYALLVVGLMFVSIIQFYSGRWVHHKATGRLLRFMHLLVLAAVLLLFVRCFNPDNVYSTYPPVINQWTSVNVTAIIICGAIFFLLNLIESVATFYGGLSDYYLLSVYGLVVVEMVGAELSVALSMFFNRWWYSCVFLFINAPLLMILLGGMTYAAYSTRKAVQDSMADVSENQEYEADREDSNDRPGASPEIEALNRKKRSHTQTLVASKFKSALSKLLWVQIGASVMIVLTIVFCFAVGVPRLKDKNKTLDEALAKDPLHYTMASVDWALWLQIVTRTFFVCCFVYAVRTAAQLHAFSDTKNRK